MPNPYGALFHAPGAKGFAAAGFVARLPIAMTTIGIVAMLSQTHGEYWLAGAVSATFALTNAFAAPQISRLVDRLGQGRVLLPASALAVAAFAVLLLAAHLDWPEWTMFAAAFAAGSMPSFPAMVRARWSELYSGTPKLGTAFAFESVLDELVYIAGSVLAVSLSVTLFPEAGVLLSTAFLAVGATFFVMQRSTEPAVRPQAETDGGSAIRLRSVQIITFALAAIGTIFGAAEVTVVARARELGEPAAASLVLGGYAAGSLVVGLIYGTLKLRMPLARQFLIAIAVAAAATIPLLLFSDSIPLLFVLLLLSGISISPTFITAFGLIERLVPASQLTEGMTWATTGISIGLAIGSFSSGWAIDNFSASTGFGVSVAAGAVALLTALLGQRWLATNRARSEAEAAAAA